MKDLRGYLEPDEIKKITEAAGNLRDRLLVEVLWMTGARISEVVGLSKIDAVDKQDHLDWGLTPDMLVPEENVIIFNTLKRTKKKLGADTREYAPQKRRVVVPNRLMTELADYTQQNNMQVDERIFPISRRWAGEIVKKMAECAGVLPPGEKTTPNGRTRHVHPHLFRHSHCIQFIRHNDGIEGLRKLQNRLKHISITTTAHYLQFSTKGQQKEIEEIFK
jgi:integrase/recombinase XerD